MAGIGFELNKILAKRSYTSLFKAYAYAGLIGSGPWIIAVLSLGVLGMVLSSLGRTDEIRLFFVTISVVYAFSLVFTGPIQLVYTRYAADLEFTNQHSKIFPSFIFTLSWQALLFSVIALGFFLFLVPAPLLFQLSAALLLVVVASIWLCGVLLAGLKHYRSVLIGFSVGFLASIAAAYWLAVPLGVSGAMLGFTIGHLCMFIFLLGTIFFELGSFDIAGFEFLSAYRKYWDLALGGFFYNLGIWIDKFLFWWTDIGSEQIAGVLYASPVFDKVVYFSFITVIPGMTVFLLKLETEFAQKNQNFFQHVLKKGTLNQIHELKNEMVEALRSGFLLLLKVQGLFTILLILSTDRLLELLNLTSVQAGVFQIVLLGVFLLVVFLALLTILYYLDKRRDAMWCSLVFMLTNALVTSITIAGGQRWFGFGFFVASGVALVIAAVRVNKHLDNLVYDTFTSQPIYG